MDNPMVSFQKIKPKFFYFYFLHQDSYMVFMPMLGFIINDNSSLQKLNLQFQPIMP